MLPHVSINRGVEARRLMFSKRQCLLVCDMTESNRLSGNRTPVRATQSPDQPSITLAANYTAMPRTGATQCGDDPHRI